MMRELHEFMPGTMPPAALMQEIVEGVRELLARQGVAAPLVRRPGRVMRCFTVSGTAVGRCDAEGVPCADVAEILWQLGPHVAVLPGGAVEGMPEACEQAAAAAAACGLHSDVAWAREGDDAYGATLAATGVTYQAAPWVEPADEDDGSAAFVYHGDGQAGCLLPAPTARFARQRAIVMWPMPQAPMTARRQDGAALLPGAVCEQVMASYYGGCYDAQGKFEPVLHEWRGRLDRFGRLQVSGGNFEL